MVAWNKASNEVEVLYTCVVCGRAFTKRQSLAAHLRSHRDIEWATLHVRLPKEKVEEFERLCRKHKTTTCNLLLALIDALIAGEERGLVRIGSPNPLTIVVNQYFAQLPKRRGKYSPRRVAEAMAELCPRCGSGVANVLTHDGRHWLCAKCAKEYWEADVA